MNTKEEIKKIVDLAVCNLALGDFNLDEIVIVKPNGPHGDYATNASFFLAGKIKKNPIEVSGLLLGEIEKIKSVKIDRVEAVGGFINFYLKKEVFDENINQILKGKSNFGKNDVLKNKKIIVEYTDPNILKEFHIGHLMSNAIGESISRILQFSGAKIKRVTWQSDVGISIAKAVFGKIKNVELSWQQAYVFGTKEYEENDLAKQEITALNKKIFERSDKVVNKVYDEGKKWSLKYFEKIYATLGSKFDFLIFESQSVNLAKKIIADGLKKNIFEKGDNGAIIFKGEKYGLHTRVFINSQGLPTYEAKEMALAKIKYEKYKYDMSVVITGNEVNDYFKVMMCAMAQIFPGLQQKTTHIGHGMMRLPEGKMSSRSGTAVTFESLLDQLEKMVAEKISDRDLAQIEKKEICEKVAVGALKYSILKQSANSDIIYNAEKSINFQGDSGPYLQYALARAISILNKAKQEKIKISLEKIPDQISSFVKMMLYFPDVIQKASQELEPHIIALYLMELASAFNYYYAENKIVDINDEFSGYKVALTQAFVVIIKNGLWLLGVPVLEKM